MTASSQPSSTRRRDAGRCQPRPAKARLHTRPRCLAPRTARISCSSGTSPGSVCGSTTTLGRTARSCSRAPRHPPPRCPPAPQRAAIAPAQRSSSEARWGQRRGSCRQAARHTRGCKASCATAVPSPVQAQAAPTSSPQRSHSTPPPAVRSCSLEVPPNPLAFSAMAAAGVHQWAGPCRGQRGPQAQVGTGEAATEGRRRCRQSPAAGAPTHRQKVCPCPRQLVRAARGRRQGPSSESSRTGASRAAWAPGRTSPVLNNCNEARQQQGSAPGSGTAALQVGGGAARCTANAAPYPSS